MFALYSVDSIICSLGVKQPGREAHSRPSTSLVNKSDRVGYTCFCQFANMPWTRILLTLPIPTVWVSESVRMR